MIVFGIFLIGIGQFAMMIGSLCGVVMHEGTGTAAARKDAIGKSILTAALGFLVFGLGLFLCLAGVTHS